MIDIIEISVNEIAIYAGYIPITIQQEYIFNKNLVLVGVLQADIPSGVVVLERFGNEMSLVYQNLDDALKDTEYEEEVFLSVLAYVKQERYQTFAMEYQKTLNRRLHDNCEVLGFGFTDLESGYFRFRIKDIDSDILKNGKGTNAVALKNVEQHKIDVIESRARESYELYVDTPISKDDYDADCSCLYLDKNVPKGMLLAKQVSDSEIVISMMYSDGTAMMAPLEMLQYLTNQVCQKYSDETYCSITAVDAKMVAFIRKVTGQEVEYRTRAVLDLSQSDSYESEIAKLLA